MEEHWNGLILSKLAWRSWSQNEQITWARTCPRLVLRARENALGKSGQRWKKSETASFTQIASNKKSKKVANRPNRPRPRRSETWNDLTQAMSWSSFACPRNRLRKNMWKKDTMSSEKCEKNQRHKFPSKIESEKKTTRNTVGNKSWKKRRKRSESAQTAPEEVGNVRMIRRPGSRHVLD